MVEKPHEIIIKEQKNYVNTIYFFAAFSKYLKKHGIKHELEFDIADTKGNKKTPDFVIFDDTNITSIKEHKASLPKNKDYFLRKVKEIKEKYSNVVHKGKNYQPNLIMFCPNTCIDVINECEKDIEDEITLMVFDLNIEEEIISFVKIIGEVKDSILKNVLNLKTTIPLKRDDFSKYKFIRKEPHPTYSAWVLWNTVFSYFMNPFSLREDYYKIQYNNLLAEVNTLFPSWIGDREQLSVRNINKALKFLDKINFINYKIGEKDITVFRRKGLRVTDLPEYFAKKYIKLEEKKLKRIKSKKGKDKSLIEYFNSMK
jgi:DNA-binding MarR family transcriptional regulator